jgi:hypothetical protein
LRRKQVFTKDWEQKLDEFLRFNDRNVLPNAGSVSKKIAETHARDEYEQFAHRRREHKEAVGEAESIKALEEVLSGAQGRAPKRGRKKSEGGE